MDLLGSHFLVFVAIGLCAQLIDGALGMAYGLVSSSILLAMGMPPAAVSASVHTAEVFTTGVSGAAHGMLGNVDRRLMLRLALPGVVGGVIGATVLSQIDGDAIKPWIHAYLFVLALLILLRAAGRRVPRGEVRRVGLLGFISGLLDAIGGGGWGPMATSTLLAKGGEARTTIGSVSASEFAVTLAISITFLLTIGLEHWRVIAGLLVGGVIAAPLAALLVRHVRERVVLFAVGGLVMAIAGVQIVRALVA
ncbi:MULTISPECIES: sulfite exporter TauE/SafE family protein [unclassified Luteimonas]